MIQDYFEVMPLRTRNVSEATQFVRGEIVRQTGKATTYKIKHPELKNDSNDSIGGNY
jgi:hypothetical protein